MRRENEAQRALCLISLTFGPPATSSNLFLTVQGIYLLKLFSVVCSVRGQSSLSKMRRSTKMEGYSNSSQLQNARMNPAQ